MARRDDCWKHELECLRLAAECMQLVGDAPSPTLQRHFLGMARLWTTKAENGPLAHNDQTAPNPISEVDLSSA